MKSLYRLFLFFLTVLLCSGFASAIDLNNITFTNEEFFNGAVTATKSLELSTGKLLVAYTKSTGNIWGKLCDLDATNCGSEIQMTGSGVFYVSYDIFEDINSNKIFIIGGHSTNGWAYTISNTLIGSPTFIYQFNAGATNYVSAVQTNSTHFAIAFQDTADSNIGKIITCQLDGSSCGTEILSAGGSIVFANILKKLSNGNLGLFIDRNGLGVYYQFTTSLVLVGSGQVINGAASSYPDMIEGSDNKLKIVYRDNGNSNYGTFQSCDLDGTNCGGEIIFNSAATAWFSLIEAQERLYVAYDNTVSSPREGALINFNLSGSEISNNSLFSNESVATRNSLIFTSNQQLLISYRDTTNSKGMFAISEAFPSGAVVTINNPIDSSYLNNLLFTLNVSTDLSTNLTYSLNGASNITLGTDINTSVSTITGIEGNNNITVYSNFSGEITFDTSSFTIDTIDPIINNNILPEYNSYIINGFNSSCTDTNLASCNISLNSQNVELNTSSFTFTSNGNITYNITAIDLAGNSINESGTILINPYQRFHFSDGTLLDDFTFGGVSFAGTEANFTTFGDILVQGDNTLLFERLGYVSENFTFNINSTSDINITYNVTAAQIIVNLFNRLDGSVLTSSVEVSILGLGNITTATGQALFQNFSFLPGTYHIEAVSTGFYTAEKDFTYSGESNSIINIYLLNETQSNAATLITPVLDEFFNIIENSDTRLLEYDPAILGFKEVSQCRTNSNGECVFLIEVGTKTYIVTTSKDIGGVLFEAVSSTDGEIFQPEISEGGVLVTEYIRQLFLKISSVLASPESIGLRISVPANENETIVSINQTNTVINVPVSYTADNGLSYTVCFEIYRTTGNSYSPVIVPICDTGSAGILPTSNIVLDNTFSYQARVTIEYDGDKTTYKTYNYQADTSFINTLLNEGYAESFILLFWVILLSAALYLRSIGLWVYGSWILASVQTVVFLSLLVGSSSVLIILINAGVLYISKKTVDAQ